MESVPRTRIGEAEITPGKAGAEPVILGTHVRMSQLVEYLKGGLTLQDAGEDFGVHGPPLQRLLDEMHAAYLSRLPQSTRGSS